MRVESNIKAEALEGRSNVDGVSENEWVAVEKSISITPSDHCRHGDRREILCRPPTPTPPIPTLRKQE